jgi:RNA polymerase sigma-70 factor, ECF subfamily
MTVAFSQPGHVDSGARRVDAPLDKRAASLASSSDEALIRRIASGDQLAMRTLFARHQVPLYRFALRIVRDATLAEDVLSETFLAVWRQAAQFEARSSVATWLVSIARFKAITALRRRSERRLDDALAERIVDPADNPEAALQKKDRAERLRAGLAALSAQHAEVIDLVYYHGKSVSEVAEIAGIPESTAKTRMFYARKHLAQLVQAA